MARGALGSRPAKFMVDTFSRPNELGSTFALEMRLIAPRSRRERLRLRVAEEMSSRFAIELHDETESAETPCDTRRASALDTRPRRGSHVEVFARTSQ